MKPRSGFSLMEVLVGLMLAMVLMIPVYSIFTSGSQQSLQGIQQIEMVMEGRRILRRIRLDLKSACLVLPAGAGYYSFPEIMRRTKGAASSLEGTTFTFLSFPSQGDLGAIVTPGVVTGPVFKCANEISYSIVPSDQPGGHFLCLIRRERFHPKLGGDVQTKVLSKRLNYFDIQPVEIQSPAGRNQWFFNVTLQLAAARKPHTMQQLPEAGRLLDRQQGLLLADFFDVVCPVTFHNAWNQVLVNRNWNCSIQGP